MTLTATLNSDNDTPAAAATTAPVAAVVVLTTSLSLALVTVVMYVALAPAWSVDTWFTAVDVTVAVVYGLVSWLMLARSRHSVAWCFALAAVGCGLSAVAAMYAVAVESHPDLPASAFIISMVGWGWVPGTLALVVVVPWLVRDSPLPRRARAAVVAGWIVVGAIFVCRITHPAPWPDGEPFMPLAIRSTAWGDLLDTVLPWLFVALVVLGLIATFDVGRRWRRGPLDERRGLGWLVIGSALMTLSFVPLTFPSNWFEGSTAVSAFTPVSMLLAQAFLPAAALVAILRQQMWEIDFAVSRTLVWSLLTGALVVLYLVVVAFVGSLVDSQVTASALAGAAVALAINPARTWMQRRVEHLVRGDTTDPSRAVRRLGRRIGRAGEGDDLLAEMTAAVVDSLRLASATVEVADGDRRVTRVQVGQPEGHREELELVVRSQTVGWLVVTAPHGIRIDSRAHRVLASVAPVLSAGVALADLSAEVTRTQSRLTAARLEERRILRRDLHDGLGPALAGIELGLQASRNLRASDPAAADRLLDALATEVAQQATAVRTLSRTLLPPVLEELGLVAALDELAARYSSGSMHVSLNADLDRALSADLSAACYAIISEALVNAHRHADASAVVIRIAADIDTSLLAIDVTDDGLGLPSETNAGVGLRSMSERAAEFGGTCAVTTGQDRGVTVSVRFPLGGRP